MTMGATTPEGLGELVAAAYKANDAEALRDLYEEDAVLANSVAGYTAVGRDAIIEKHKENFALEIACVLREGPSLPCWRDWNEG
jgi:ketosteroid isomerase-like protein